METVYLVLVLWVLGLVAAQQLVIWIHAVVLFGLVSHAARGWRRDRTG